MAIGLSGEDLVNSTPEEKARLKRANTAQLYADILTASQPVLPTTAKVTYMDEGAANVVYMLSVESSDEEPEEYKSTLPNAQSKTTGSSLWDGKLLRLRKQLPWTAPCALAQADFLIHIYPRFDSDHLVEQHLVEVETSGIVQRLNEELIEWDKIPADYKGSCQNPRPEKHRGNYLAFDSHGLLVENMTLRLGLNPDVELLEVKPKWLSQSRSAPQYAKRCRTCAKRARENAKCVRKGKVPWDRRCCPLDLVSKDEAALNRAACAILNMDNPVTHRDKKRLHQISQWVRNSPLLPRLASLQASLDTAGVFAADPNDKEFLAAMTLRDCSLFLQVPEDPSAPIVAKIGDLDLKRPEKAEYWKEVERSLLEEGWYMGTENEEDRQPLDCNLFPEYWTPMDLKVTLQPKKWSDTLFDKV